MFILIDLSLHPVKYLLVLPSGGMDLDRESIWIRKGNTATSLDREEVFYPEHDGYQVARIIRGEEYFLEGCKLLHSSAIYFSSDGDVLKMPLYDNLKVVVFPVKGAPTGRK